MLSVLNTITVTAPVNHLQTELVDFIHHLLRIIFPLLTILFLSFFMPPYLILKLISNISRSFRPENVAGKVVLITGASSGIGEHIAYEYARKGAHLALVARREDRLGAVADKSRRLGSPDVLIISTDVLIIPTDVSRSEDCKIVVDKAVDYFGCHK
ncbi:11-beta-hydroxysteroid dehydrogenase-like 2 [Hibiscus syriacus]|uniref:11-beta-hydroxysteroid dehydrogenase-like 2 n=1 Tax=Hibiscus syriacus TaxID=106335 RepID=A0A6A3AQ57_HIBSY|nr:11-beta-hydroxysteroid dehydrogenase-like 2 [Hibiscus syriacus]